jgi:hypothetical protein
MSVRNRAVIASLLALGAIACGGAPEADESPEAVPGMDGQTRPSIGTGVSEQPDQ